LREVAERKGMDEEEITAVRRTREVLKVTPYAPTSKI
jgi:hypothetical protein